MDLPGMSLFQGTESLQLNTSAQQHIEEEDELEDQKRRNEELKNELQTAFDDLDDEYDDEDDTSDFHRSIDSVAKSPAIHGVCKRIVPNGIAHSNGNQTEMENEMHRLQNIIASNESELKNIAAISAADRKRYESQIDELKKRLAIAEAEKERAHMSRKQTHELFVESKQKLAERDDKMSELNARIKLLESRNAELVAELEHSKAMVSDLQHKYMMVERCTNMSSDKHTDAVVRQLSDKHAAQAEMMQHQINTMRAKLDERDAELRRLMIQNNELQQSREAMLIDKSDTINQLTHKLEESQRQCQNLLMKSGSGDGELAHKLSMAEFNARDMQRTIDELTLRLETTAAEIENASVDMASHEICSTPLTRFPSKKHIPFRATPNTDPLHNAEDHLGRLKQEFQRCLNDLKSKRQEITAVRDQLASKVNEIERMRAEENRNLIELNTNRERIDRLESKLKLAETELRRISGKSDSNEQKNGAQTSVLEEKLSEQVKANEELQSKVSELTLARDEFEDMKRRCQEMEQRCRHLEEEKVMLEHELRNSDSVDARKEICELKNSLANIQRAKQLTELKCDELKKSLERITEECEAIRSNRADHSVFQARKDDKNLTNDCEKCMSLSVKITELEIENLQLQASCAAHLKEIGELRKSLKRSKRTIDEIEAKLAIKKEHDQLLNDLKKKAEQFELFMRNQSPNSREALALLDNSSRTGSVRDQCISTDDTIEIVRSESSASCGSTADRSVERRIREEMARAMAAQVKAIENQFKEKIHDSERRLEQLAIEYSRLSTELTQKGNDVQALKECVLKERAAFQEILKQKDADTEMDMLKVEEAVSAMQNELLTAHKRIEYLTREMDESSEQYQTERQSSQKLMDEWKREIASFAEREHSLVQQMRAMENDHQQAMDKLSERYTAAKKTAANYKKYAEDKEEHIKRESERIKQAYAAAVKKCKENMETAIKEQKRKAEKKIADIKSKYERCSE